MSIPASRTIDRLRVYEKYRCVHSVEQYFRFCRDTTDFFFSPTQFRWKVHDWVADSIASHRYRDKQFYFIEHRYSVQYIYAFIFHAD